MSENGKPRDINQLAAHIVSSTTDEDSHRAEDGAPDTGKDPAAVLLGQKGGRKGGNARARKLTPEERSEIARIAAQARWRQSKD